MNNNVSFYNDLSHDIVDIQDKFSKYHIEHLEKALKEKRNSNFNQNINERIIDMEQLEPKFLIENYGYYTDDGLQIKDDAPQWAKDEYKEFMRELNSNGEFIK